MDAEAEEQDRPNEVSLLDDTLPLSNPASPSA